MRNNALLLITLLTCFAISCKKKNTPAEVTAKSGLKIKMNTIAGGTAIVPGGMNIVNAKGQIYSVDVLKYYVSKMELKDENGNVVPLNNYDLVDIEDNSSSLINVPTLPYGKYTSLKINLGIDKDRNHQGAQDGDLDPIHGMIWTWSTGYIFYKHEGYFKMNDNTNKVLVFHLGTDDAYANVTVPITWNVTADSKQLYIDFDINKMYNDPVIDFTVDNSRQSTTQTDMPWVESMKLNAADAFSFNRAE